MAHPARNTLTGLLLAAALLPAPGKAADVYLDTNGVTAGSGNADATWDAATALWGDALGTATPLAWTAGDIAILAAGSDYTGTRTLTVSGTQALGGLKLSSSNTGLGTLTVTGGTLDFGATLGSIDFSAWGSTNNKNLNLTSTLVGTGGLEIRAFGDLSASGGGNGSRFNLNGTNTFTGNVTIKSGLVAYSSNAAFGAAANRILLDGGGLLDPNLNVTLARDIEVLAGGGTLRAYGSATMTHSGALLGSGTINRTDGGTVVHSGDLSGWLGTYNVQRGTTRLEGTSTARGNWVLGEGTTGVTLSFGGSSERRFEGTVTQTVGAASTLRFTGTSRANFAGTATGISTVAVDTTSDATISGSLTADSLSMNGQGSVLRVVDGANVSFSYLNIGDGGGTSGHILQTGGTFAIRAGNSAAMRLGHWNSSGNRSSLINISGGTFDASATATLNIGWDGDGDVIVGGGSGAALFKASAIQLDANGNNAEYNDTLAILSNGTVEVAGAINAASDNDRTFLSGGTLRLTAAADTTWGTAITATDATASALDVGGRNLTLSSGSLLGSGTVNLSSAAGSLILSNAGNHTLPWGIAGSTAITKTGAGTLTYTGSGNHSGAFAVSAGRLDVASGAATQSAVSVNSAATIGGKGSVGSLTLSSGAFLNLGAAASGALTTGNLTLSGATLRFDSYGAAAAPVSVVTYTGALSGAFGTDLAVEGAANYRSTTFADTAGVVTLDLGTKNLTWSGAGGGQWNIKSATRWNSDADVFAWGDHVTFSGASANTSVTLTGELRPGSVTVAGDTNYTLTGSSGNFLAGPMALAKTGSSTLTVTGPNTFTGGTFVSQGTLIVGGSDNNALGTGAITLGDASSGANALSLLLANGRTINNTVTVSSQATGAVTLGFSGTGSSYTAFEGGLVLQRDLIISPAGNGDRLNFGGVISGSGNITIQGGSRVTFSNSNTWTGNLTVTGSGTIYQTFNGNSIPDSANVTVDSGATFRIYSSDTIAGLNGAGNIRPIAGKPTLTVGGNNASGTFSGTWTSDGWDHLAVSKIGTGTQTISGTIANPGDLIINAGTVAISGTGEFGRNAQSSTASPTLGLRGAGTLRIDAGANLVLRRNSDFTGTVNVAGGTLTLAQDNAVNTAAVTLSGGTLAFDNRGALFTVLSGDVRTGGTLATHTTTTNFASLHNTSGDVIPGSTTHVYNGRIYLTAGQWSFVKNFDDTGSITVNGTTVINDATWNSIATGSITIAADGWYDFDVRANNGSGGVGPTAGWTKGIGIKKGATSTSNADYAAFDLAGVASLGGGLVYANNLTFARAINVTAASVVDTSNLVGTVGSTAGDGNGTGGDLTLSGVISGTGNLTKTGAGTLTLSAANTLTGALVASGGRIEVTNTLRGVSGITVNPGATVQLNAINTLVGGHGVAVDASRVLTVDGGTLIFGSGFESRFGSVTLRNGATWTTNRGTSSYDALLANVSTGAATVTVANTGGNTSASTLNGTGGIRMQGVQNFSIADVTGNADADLVVTAVISGTGTSGGDAGGINKTGAGTLLLNAANGFAGATTVGAGAIWVGDGTNATATLGSNSAATVASGATLGFFHAGSVTVANVLSGAGTVALRGTAVTGQTQYAFSGANTGLTGAVSILSGARLNVDNAADIGSAAVTVASGGQFWANSATTLSNALNIQGDGWSETAGQLGAIRFNSGTTLSGAITLSGNARLTAYQSGDTGTISGVISGAGFGITKTGAGTLTLSAINTFTGGTTVAGGILVLNNGGQSGVVRGTVNVESGAILRSSAGDSTGWGTSNQITAINLNGGEFNVATTANQTLGNAVITLTGGSITGVASSNLDFFQGSSALASAASATTSVVSGVRLSIRQTAGLTVTVADGAAADDLRIESVIRNDPSFTSAPLVKAGAGVLRLTGASVFGSNLTVNAGTLAIGSGGRVYSGGYFGTPVISVNSGGTLELENWGYGETSQSLGGLRNNANAIVVSGGTIRISGATATTYDRGVTVNSGGITLEAASGADWTLSSGEAFVYSGNPSVTLAGAGTGAFNKAFSGTGGLTKSGAGTWTLGAAATHSGATAVTAGTLRLGSGGSLSSSTALTVASGATFDLSGASTSVASLAGLGAVSIGSGLTLTAAGSASTTFSGSLSGSGNLAKSGGGTLTLSAASAGFSGAVTVSGSTLALGNAAAAGTGAITLDGGTLAHDVAGSTVANAIVAGSGGGTLLGRQTVDNYTTFSGALSGAGNLTIDGLVTLSGSGSGFSGRLIVADASSYLRLGTSATSSANVVQITAGNVRVDGSAGGSTYTLGGLSAGQVGAVFGAPDAGANVTLDLAVSTGSQTYGGEFSKNGSALALRKSGGGTQVLNRSAGNGQNLSSVAVTGGVLELAGGAVGFDTGYFTGSQAFSVSGGGTLRVSQAWNLAAGNSVSLNGGTLDVTNDANYLNTLSLAGGSTVSGALRLGNQGNASLASAGDQTNTVSSTLALVSNGGIRTLTLNVADGAAASDLAITGNITDLSGYAGSRVSKAGAGTLTLSGANTFNGGLAITAGRVDATSLGALGAGAVSVGASGELRLSLALTGALDLSTAFTPGIGGTGLLDLNLTGEHALSLGSYASTFGGSVRLTSGIFDNTGFAGNVIFAGGRLLDATAFTGTTTVSGSITDVSQLPTSGTIVLASGGSIDFGSGPAFTGTITYRGGSVAGSAFQGTLAVDGSNVAVSGGFGNGKLSVGAGNSVVLSGATTGTLVFAGGAISGGANLAGRLELASGQSLVLGQDIDALGASATLAVGAGSSVDLAGSSTAATIAFTGGSIANAQSFTGTIAVSGGAKLTTDGTVGGAVTLASGTTLAGNGTFTGTVTAGAGSILAPGSSPGVTTYGTLSLTGGSIIQLEFFSASETVTVGVDTERGYDTLQATTINFGNAGQQGGGQILLQLATLTDWEDSVTDWNATNGFVPAAGSSLLLTPGQEKIFTIARFTSSDRALTDNLNITSWFAFDTDLFEVPGATSFEVIANADGSNWELNLRVVPEPSTYGLILGGLALAGAAIRRRRRKG